MYKINLSLSKEDEEKKRKDDHQIELPNGRPTERFFLRATSVTSSNHRPRSEFNARLEAARRHLRMSAYTRRRVASQSTCLRFTACI